MLPRNAKDKKIFLIEKKMIDQKAIEQQAMLFSPYHYTRSDVMMVFSRTRHLWQILQLGTTCFDISIKSDFLEFQSCREMLNTISGWQDNWTRTRNLWIADGCHQIINCFIITLNSGIINNSSAQLVLSWHYFSDRTSTLRCSPNANKVRMRLSIKSFV